MKLLLPALALGSFLASMFAFAEAPKAMHWSANRSHLDRKTNIVKLTIPAPIIIPRYRIGYWPMKTNIHTIEKIRAVVEKFAGSTNAKTAKTGAHNSNNESLNEYSLSLTLDK